MKIKRIPLSHIFALIITVLFTAETNLHAADVDLYLILKEAGYGQDDEGVPLPHSMDPGNFLAEIEVNASDSITMAMVVPPGSSPLSLVQGTEGDWFIEQNFASNGDLDSSFPDGMYFMNMYTANDGNISALLNLNSDPINGLKFPAAPHFTNYTAAQMVDPNLDFTLTWDAFANGNAGDLINLEIETYMGGNKVFETSLPPESGSLDYTATSVTIPAGTLQPGTDYLVVLNFINIVDTNDTNYMVGNPVESVTGLAGYLASTDFVLSTTGEGVPESLISMIFQSGGNFTEPTGSLVGVDLVFPTNLYYFPNFSVVDTELPDPSQVFFSGPPGSQYNNSPAMFFNPSEDFNFYGITNVSIPPYPPSGTYSVNYKGMDITTDFDTSMAEEYHLVILPAVMLDSNNNIQSVSWTYRDPTSGDIISPVFPINGFQFRITRQNGPAFSQVINDQLSNINNLDLSGENIPWADITNMDLQYNDLQNLTYNSFYIKEPGGQTGNGDPPVEEKIITRITAAGYGADDFDQGGVPGAIRGEGAPELIEVSAGLDHNIGLRNDGSVVGWGRDQAGQSTIPDEVSGVTDVDAGYNHNLAIISNGTVVAWGNNDFGQTDVPAGLSNVIAVSAGGSHSLALLSDGTVVGWGNNDNGQATPPGDLSDVIALAAGGFHNLALKSDGTVVAWGLNDSGQTDVPSSLSNVTQISAGDKHSLALTEDSNTVAWGDNTFGQLDVPFTAAQPQASMSAKNEITVAFNASAVTSIAAGLNHNLALDASGEVIGWGLNDSGQAEAPAGVVNVTSITAGGRHNVVLTEVARLILDGSGDVAGENIAHPNGNVFDQVLLTGEFIQLQAKDGQITRVSFMDETEDIVQVEFSGSGTFTLTLDPATFLPPATPPRYNQAVEYVTGKPSVLIDGANSNTFFSIFTVGSINAVNQALFPEGQVYDAQADVTLVEVINSSGIGGMQLSNTVFGGSTGKVGVDARGVPVAVRLTVGDIDASGDAVAYLLFGTGSFTVPAGNPGLRVTGGDLAQSNGASIVIAESGSTTPGFETLITQNNFKSDNTPQPTQSINATFSNEDGDDINVTVEELTIE